jgi:predicted amidohydrolase
VVSNGRHYIATLLVDSTGSTVVYRKIHLGYGEQARFRPGPRPQAITLEGCRVCLGICRDTGIDEHVRGTRIRRARGGSD